MNTKGCMWLFKTGVWSLTQSIRIKLERGKLNELKIMDLFQLKLY